jgi:phosphotransferase system enzyme I (PtsP)
MTRSRHETVHVRGNRRLDAVLDLLAFFARPMPLVTLLDEAPRRIANVFDADVCSLYLLEGDGHELVMRANVGFSVSAIGQVRLAVGEGLTGRAVEYMRPVSSASAPKDVLYRHFEEIDEDRYPSFLAVPVRGKSGALGALVLQRTERAFDDRDIELSSALGALIGAGFQKAELMDAARDKFKRKTGGGTRRITLPGRSVVLGRSLGAMFALRRPAARQSERRVATGQQSKDEVNLLKGAFDVAGKALHGLRERAKQLHLGKDAHFLSTYTEIIGDMRFQERCIELVEGGSGIAQALSRVARQVTRTAATIMHDPFLEERAKDVEDLCDAIAMLAGTDKRAALPAKAILLGDGITVYDLIISARSQPVGVALTERASGPRTRTLLKLLGVPAVVGIVGLFRWVSDGDVVLLDADHGLIVINPSKSEIITMREYTKK